MLTEAPCISHTHFDPRRMESSQIQSPFFSELSNAVYCARSFGELDCMHGYKFYQLKKSARGFSISHRINLTLLTKLSLIS